MILNTKELSCLLIHLNVMRNNVKKGFKRLYGRSKGKEMINIYDDLKNTIEGNFERLGDEDNETKVNLSDNEKDMLQSFLIFYIHELQVKAEQENIDKNNEILETLKTVQEKLQKNLSPSYA